MLAGGVEDLALQGVGAGDVGLVAFLLRQPDLGGTLPPPGQVQAEQDPGTQQRGDPDARQLHLRIRPHGTAVDK
ncbi:hypothetical protein V5P93_003948 [Actinokineospora auranticolor]|uniref:hypothetical protein n=1 Tax=Actinokineospora auranticolor TaxID=155976 RepID=UPI0015E38798|nr:hypothetical protein [Actinokineospora auranticolor]